MKNTLYAEAGSPLHDPLCRDDTAVRRGHESRRPAAARTVCCLLSVLLLLQVLASCGERQSEPDAPAEAEKPEEAAAE